MSAAAAAMSSVQALREFINQRLTAAALEIFTVFERTIVQYEEQMDRQRRLMDGGRTPAVRVHSAEPDQRVSRQGALQGQEGAEPPWIKEEPEEAGPVRVTVGLEVLGGSEEEEQLAVKEEEQEEVQEEVQAFLVTLTDEGAAARSHADGQSNVLLRLSDRRRHDDVSQNRRETDTAPHGVKPHGCDTCGKVFSHRAVLFRHRKTHTGERPHACDTCGKRFSEHAVLRRHRRTHTGEKPYACQTCGKRFSQHGNMLVHTRTHTGQRPYRCQTCGKSFSQQGTLLRHGRTHAAQRPRHVCAVCTKSYSERAALRKHLLAHAGAPT